MADERIDVEIADKIDGNIDKKLASIDTTAKKAHSSVQLLRKELASIRAGSLNQLATALNQNAAATLKAEAASSRAATAAQKLATEQQRTAKMAAQAEAAQLRLAAAQDRQAASAAKAAASAAKPRLGTLQGNIDASLGIGASAAANGATSARLLAQAEREAAEEASTLAARIQALKASTDPMSVSIDRINAELAEAGTLYRQGAIDANTYATAQGVLQARLAAATTAQGQYNDRLARSGKAMGLTGSEAANLSRQMADIGVSAAMGMNPLMILIQQGPQIADVFQTARARGVGFTAALRGLVPAGLAATLAALAAALALVGLAFADVKSKAASDAEMKKFIGTLGLTRDEIKRLENTTVTWGDVGKATFEVLAERAGTSGKEIKEKFTNAWKTIMDFGRFSVAVLVAAFVAGFRGIARVILGLPKIVAEGVIGAINLAIAAIEKLINLASAGLNKVIDGVNGAFGLGIERVGEVAFDRLENRFAGSTASIAKGIRDDFVNTFNEVNSIFDDISARATKLRQDDLRKQAGEIIADRNPTKGKKPPKPKEDKTAENRAKALAEVNRELDRELALMGLVGPAREIESRFTQIQNSLLEKKIVLDKYEAQALREKITEVVRLGGVQSQLERIYSSLIEPAKTHNDTVEAATKLLNEGKISQAQYNREVANSARAVAVAADPFLQMNEARAQENELLGKYGRELAIATAVQARYNELRAIDASITAAALPGIEAEIRALTRKAELQAQMSNAESDIMGAAQEVQANEFLIENYETLYARIAELRAQDVLSEQGAIEAKADLNERLARARLANETKTLDALAALQQSGVKEFVMIGKAAAITQATIDGYLAVQKALATLPVPMNYVAAAAIGVMTAANVAKIASTGYEKGGYTGNFGRKEIAGVVHGREFVMNADATQRNRPLLEAMNRGDSPAGYMAGGFVQQPTTREPGAAAPPAGSAGAANVGNGGQAGIADRFKIVNVLDPREALSALDTYEGEQLIVNVIERRANDVSAIMGAR